MKNNKKKAFTLVELLVVITIIGILFIVLVSKLDFATDKAKATGVQTDFRSFQLAFETVAREQAGFSGLVSENNYSALEQVINRNLDKDFQIEIDDITGNITMVYNAKDPWQTEYHGKYISGTDGKDRGAIVMYSNGPDFAFGSNATIANGIVMVEAINTSGQDDYVIVSCYSLANGKGEIDNMTLGFSNNLLLNTNTKPSIPDIEPETPSCNITEGANQTITSYDNVTFRSNATIDTFESVWVDGAQIDSSNYTVTEGSIVIRLKPEYVETLSLGEHTITIKSTDGDATCKFYMEVAAPTINLTPGLYPAGTIRAYWNKTVTKSDAEELMLETWDELISSGKIVLNTYNIGVKVKITNAIAGADLVCDEVVVGDDYDWDNFGTLDSIAFKNMEHNSTMFAPSYINYFFCEGRYVDLTNRDPYNSGSCYFGRHVFDISTNFYLSNISIQGLDPNNTHLKLINGDLYSHDGTEFILLGSHYGNEPIYIAEGTKKIRAYACYERNTNLKFILPEGVVEIGERAFAGNYSTEYIVLPSTLETIGSYAFAQSAFQVNERVLLYYNGSYNEWLDKVATMVDGYLCFYSDDPDQFNSYWHYVNGVPTMWESEQSSYSFKFTLENGVAKITGLTGTAPQKLIIPQTIGGCPVVSIKLAYSGGNFNNLEEIVLPQGLQIIENSAFSLMFSLKKINIPDTVTTIGAYAFSVCNSLTEIYIPNSVTTVGERIFDEAGWVRVYCEASSKPNGWSNIWNEYYSTADSSYHTFEPTWGYNNNN